MGICNSARVVNREDILLKGVSRVDSPTPRISLQSCKDAASIDATVLGELYRAGLANLANKKEHCNFINVFPVPGMLFIR